MEAPELKEDTAISGSIKTCLYDPKGKFTAR